MADTKLTLVGLDEFRKLCLDVLPLADKLREALEKNGVKDLVGLTLSADGYLAFHTHETEFEMNRTGNGKPARITYHFSEEIFLDMEETR